MKVRLDVTRQIVEHQRRRFHVHENKFVKYEDSADTLFERDGKSRTIKSNTWYTFLDIDNLAINK